MTYIENYNPDESCVFCAAAALADGPENLIVARGQHTFVILNRYPYTSGHLMVVPFDHAASLEDLNSQTLAEMMELTRQGILVLRKIYIPQGLNVGVNIGEAAGAGILNHVHMHIVPRWIGDTNFMSALGETRVLPEDLERTYERVLAAWNAPTDDV